MADFRQNLKVAIESVFDADGFQALRATARRTSRMVERFRSDLRFAMSDSGFRGDRGQFVSPDQLNRTDVMRERMSRLGNAFGITNDRMNRAKGGLSKVARNMGNVSVNAHRLQMQLLGLQFQMLAIAFIFGAFIASALGAVGAFQLLGSAIKFVMLPVALDLLDPIINISEALFGLDEQTRRTVGQIFAIVAVAATLISVFAVLLNGIVTIAGAFSGLASFLGGLLGLNSLYGAFLKINSIILKFTGTVLSAFSMIVGIIGGAVAAFLIVIKVAQKFGKIVALAVGAVLIAIGAVVAAVASIPIVVAAAIGVIVGAILGLIVVFREELVGAIMFVLGVLVDLVMGGIDLFMGLINFIVNDVVGAFVKMGEMIYNFLFGNSIFPDLINGIIGLFFKLPKAAFRAATQIVNSIVRGIKGAGSAIFDAFKSVLPDFVVDAMEGVGSTVANVGSGIANAASSFTSGVVNTAQNLNPFGRGGPNTGNGGNPNVTNNDVTVNANLTQTESTPQEEEERMSQIIAQGTNNETGDRTGGF